MANHHHHHHHHHHSQGKAPIYSSQTPSHSTAPKGSYSGYYPGTTAAYPTTQLVQTHSYKDYSRHEKSSVAVSAFALTEKHQIKKPQIEKRHVIEKLVIEKRVIEKHVIEKHVIEKKHRIVCDPKLAHRQGIKEVVAVASVAHAVCERHEKKKAHKPKEATSGKKHGYLLF